MRAIRLPTGETALVDDQDLAMLEGYNWTRHSGGYVKAYVGKEQVLMHRFLMRPASGEDVDHINGDRMDNRRSNLRLCTRSQNLMNRDREAGSSSQFKGVSRHSRGIGWQASITANGRTVYLGYFKNEMDAARAYNEAARLYHGEFARINIVNVTTTSITDAQGDTSEDR